MKILLMISEYSATKMEKFEIESFEEKIISLLERILFSDFNYLSNAL